MSCEYVRQYYKVPAEIGRRITHRGRAGIIVADRGHYIGVNFDDQKPSYVSNVHPTSEVIYGEMGQIRKMTPAQARYQQYRDSECNESFAEWLGIKKRSFT